MSESTQPVISLIVAMAHDRVIGKDNQMPWHLPADLKHFKAVTLGKPVIMGRKTFESIGMPLPGRKNIIVTRRQDFVAEDCVVVNTLDAALQAAGDVEEVMIIGGANIYGQMLDRADRLYLTLIDLDTDGDTRFPEYQHLEWREMSRQEHPASAKGAPGHVFLTLHRDRRGQSGR